MSELLKQLQKVHRESAEACIAEHLEKMGFLGLRPRAQEPTSEAEKSLADIKAEITATLEEVKAHIRENAKRQEPAPDIATQASQQEQAAPPKEEPKQGTCYDGRDLFNKVFEQALKEDALLRLKEGPVPPAQEQFTPACHPQLLKAFGLLMRRVGAPPEEGEPGPVQKAVMGLAEVLAEGSEVSVENFFDRAHMADVTARRAKLEAKITRGDRPTKYGK